MKKNMFCPLIKNKCSKEECVMWMKKGCLIVSFLERFKTIELEFPEELENKTVEELAKEMTSFIKRSPDKDDFPQILAEIFWEEMGVHPDWNEIYPVNIQLKMLKVHKLANKELGLSKEVEKEKIEKEEKQRIEKEKEELLILISECIKWARKRGFKRVTQADVEGFLLENNKKLHYLNKRELWTKVNIELKTKR